MWKNIVEFHCGEKGVWIRGNGLLEGNTPRMCNNLLPHVARAQGFPSASLWYAGLRNSGEHWKTHHQEPLGEC